MPDPKPVPPDEPLPGDIQDPRNPRPWPQPVPGISGE